VLFLALSEPFSHYNRISRKQVIFQRDWVLEIRNRKGLNFQGLRHKKVAELRRI
jgi:hypothetical protein